MNLAFSLNSSVVETTEGKNPLIASTTKKLGIPGIPDQNLPRLNVPRNGPPAAVILFPFICSSFNPWSMTKTM